MITEATTITEPNPIEVATKTIQMVVTKKDDFYISHGDKGPRNTRIYRRASHSLLNGRWYVSLKTWGVGYY
jgi:hypothetical protein